MCVCMCVGMYVCVCVCVVWINSQNGTEWNQGLKPGMEQLN